jgi:hypothetical protein
MPRIFISHAAADEALVTPFVNTVIRLGCGVGPEGIVYTSGAGTGALSGADLNAYIREAVSVADLVVAIITPAFRASSYCIAELGAAWSRAGKLFPLAVPGTRRDDLDGVLRGLVVHHLDQPRALDELHDRIADALGIAATSASIWNASKGEWLRSVEGALEDIPSTVVSVAACSRAPNHMELFWTDGSGNVFHRWWLGAGWTDVHKWEEPSTVYLAAVSRDEGDQLLFGMPRRGKVWMRSWDDDPTHRKVISAPKFLTGEVVGPLTAVSRQPSHVELAAWTPQGKQCHRIGGITATGGPNGGRNGLDRPRASPAGLRIRLRGNVEETKGSGHDGRWRG